jgi:hypothetical protein
MPLARMAWSSRCHFGQLTQLDLITTLTWKWRVDSRFFHLVAQFFISFSKILRQ